MVIELVCGWWVVHLRAVGECHSNLALSLIDLW